MIPVTTFKDKKVALFGLGGSGIVTARALLAGGADVVAFDDNPNSVKIASVEGIPTADLRELDWSTVATLVLAPGVPLTHPQSHWTVDLARKAGVEIIGDIELFSREMEAEGRRAPFIAITGTNGKSTTTALIAHVLEFAGRDVQMGGNIGRAVLDLDPVSKNAPFQAYVVECSSYQIDLTPSLNAHVGLLLNLTPDHLERHGTMKNYAAIKERLVSQSDLAVVGIDDEYCREIAERIEAARTPIIKFSHATKNNADFGFDGESIVDETGSAVVNLHGIGSLRGQHNGQNSAAAYAICQAVGLSDAEIQAGFKSFPGLAHRMEQVGHVGPVLFVNDSKATNAEAAAPALSSFEKVHWIAGGLAKDGGIESLAPHFNRIAKAYFIGEAAGNFAAQLDDTIPYEISGTLKDAVNHAALDALGEKDPVVLLSPAAASFDQFPNFEKRGEAFKAAVSALKGFEEIPTFKKPTLKKKV
ncbi:MAG: UDP-N-acetylmuramoyl-L-alanine--D-glutamate ligase [Rhizobiaceae bacterium]